MEQNTNINNTVEGFDEEAVKAQIEEEVLLEIKEQGARLVPDEFHFEKELKEIVLRYDKATADMEAYKEDVFSKYLPHVAEALFKAEKDSFELSREGFIKDVEKVSEYDKQWKYDKIKLALTSKEYAEQRAEAFRDLSYLKGCKGIPSDLVADITDNMLMNYDVKGLRIAEVMLGGQTTEAGRLVAMNRERLVHELNSINNDSHLIEEVKKYFRGGEESFLIFQLKNK